MARTRRKLLSILVTLTMVIGMLPGITLTAWAEGTYPTGIYIAGTQLETADSTATGYWSVNTDASAVTAADSESYNIAYDPNDHVLTLNNVDFTVASGTGIEVPDSVSMDLTIHLVGENTIEAQGAETDTIHFWPSSGTLTIEGEGSLKVTGSGSVAVTVSGSDVAAISARGLTIEGGAKVTANSVNGNGITAGTTTTTDCDITIEGGAEVTANGKLSGIAAYGNMEIKGQNTVLKASTSYYNAAVYAQKDLTISGATVEARTNTGRGIFADKGGNITIKDGADVTVGSNFAGIHAWEGNITIADATVRSTSFASGNDGSDGIEAFGGDITIKDGANVTAVGYYSGIDSHDGKLEITGSETEVDASNSSGFAVVHAEEDITITGARVEAIASSGSGIWTDSGDITINYGAKVTAQGAIAGVRADQGDITVFGSLRATVEGTSGTCFAAYANGSLLLDGGSLHAEAEVSGGSSATSYAVSAQQGAEVQSGTLTAFGRNAAFRSGTNLKTGIGAVVSTGANKDGSGAVEDTDTDYTTAAQPVPGSPQYLSVLVAGPRYELGGVSIPDGIEARNLTAGASSGTVCDETVTFAGWYDDADLQTPHTGAFVNGTSYYAKWTCSGVAVVTRPLDFTAATLPVLSEDFGITWDSESTTLTLDGARVLIPASANSQFAIKLPDGAIVNTVSDSTVTNMGGDTTASLESVGILCEDGGLTFGGSGKLTATSGVIDILSAGICAKGNTTIQSGAVIVATGGPSDSSQGVVIEGDLTVFGNLTGNGGDADSCSGGVWARDILIASGNLVGNSGECTNGETLGVVSFGTTLNGGSLTARADTPSAISIGLAMCTNNVVTVNAGTLIIEGGNYAALIYGSTSVPELQTAAGAVVMSGASAAGAVEDNTNYTTATQIANNPQYLCITFPPVFELGGVEIPAGTQAKDLTAGASSGTVCGETVTFAGWYTDAGYQNAHTDSSFTAGSTYYAKWSDADGTTVITTPLSFIAEPLSVFPADSGIAWDASTNTLTLNGAKVLIPASANSDFAVRLPDKAVVNTAADSIVTNESSRNGESSGISGDGALTFGGTAELSISGIFHGIDAAGVTVNRGSLKACGGNRAVSAAATVTLPTDTSLNVTVKAGADEAGAAEVTAYGGEKFLSVVCTPKSSGGGSGSSNSVTVPVSGADTLQVKATYSGQTAVLREISAQDIAKVTANSQDGNVKIDLSALPGTVSEAKLTNQTVKNLADSDSVLSVELVLTNTSVKLDSKTLDALSAQMTGSDLLLHCNVVGAAALSGSQRRALENLTSPVVTDSYFTCNGKRISDFNGGSAVITTGYTLPAGKTAAQVVGWYLDDNAGLSRVECSYANGKASITAPHFSYYVISADGEAEACTGGAGCPSGAFTDLDTGKWYHKAVDYVLENGLMSGYGSGEFGPDDTLNRAMLVTILWRQAGAPVVNYAMDFSDVSADAWYAEAVRWAASQGIVAGYDNGKFGSEDSITREQLATILYRYEQKMNDGGFQGSWMFNLDFTDADQISDWASEAMHWCVMNGILSGTGNGILAPQGTATRAQAAQMLMKYLTK